MQAAKGVLRDAAWLDEARARRVCGLALVVTIAAVLGLVATGDGFRDVAGRPIGTDFFSFWSAGALMQDAGAAAAYNLQAQYGLHERLLGPDPHFYPYLYPPPFLVLAAGFSALPYLAAWSAWTAATFAAYLGAIRAIIPNKTALLAAAAFPAAFLNAAHGQTALLTAALLGGALAVLPRRPLLAGVLIGALIFKPQAALLVPVALAAGGYWRAIGAAAGALTAVLALTTLAYGADIWTAYGATAEFTRTHIVEQGGGAFYKMQTLFGALRGWGVAVAPAYAAQAALGVAAGLGVAVVWRDRAAPFEAKAAVLLIGGLLATPYAMDYDLLMLAPAGAFLARRALREGFGPYERAALAFAWCAPFIARTGAQATSLPIGLLAVALVFVSAVYVARRPSRPAAQPGRHPTSGPIAAP
ncbi:MAG: glycosyltransferase family 87 protein [Pseudomonadota bacterium]